MVSFKIKKCESSYFFQNYLPLHLLTNFRISLSVSDEQSGILMWVALKLQISFRDIQFSSVQSLSRIHPTLCDPMNHSTPGLPVHHQLLEFTQTHGHRVSDAIQPSHPLSSHSPPAPNPSQHQGLFKLDNSSQQVAKVLEFHLQRQSFQ